MKAREILERLREHVDLLEGELLVTSRPDLFPAEAVAQSKACATQNARDVQELAETLIRSLDA